MFFIPIQRGAPLDRDVGMPNRPCFFSFFGAGAVIYLSYELTQWWVATA
jgi:hypothetical protein